MLAPEKIWWKPMGRMEKTWLTVAFVWCVFLTVMMPLWYFMGKQNVPTETYRTTPAEFAAEVNAFVQAKLNTIADPNTIGEFNKTVKSKKILTKMITDEHYLTINNNNTLQVVDGIKDAQGKPIDLDKRGHRKLV